MKYIHFICHVACLLLFMNMANAQDAREEVVSITLSDALKKSFASHLSPQIQQTAVAQAMGQKTTAGVLPNPVLSYYHEDLSLGNLESGEWILSGQLPLNFLWERWSAVSAAAAQVNVEKARLSVVEQELAFEVKKAFVEYIYAQRVNDGWEKVMTTLQEIRAASKARFHEGDISGYDHQRISLELKGYKQYATDAAAAWTNKKSYLAYLIGFAEQNSHYEAVAPQASTLSINSLEDCIAAAIANRPDLQASAFSVKNRQAMLANEKWRALPATSFSIGYKEQNDNFSGPVFQFNIGLPLFERNQGRIKAAKAMVNRQVLQAKLLKERVALEVRNAYDRFKIYQAQYLETQGDNNLIPENLLQIAQVAYREGETPLIQLLDAGQAYIDALHSEQVLVLQYYLSMFTLERVTATSLAEFE